MRKRNGPPDEPLLAEHLFVAPSQRLLTIRITEHSISIHTAGKKPDKRDHLAVSRFLDTLDDLPWPENPVRDSWGKADVRAERRMAAAALLLAPTVRDRQLDEWRDHLRCEYEAGGDTRRALRSILLRSVVPIAISSRTRRIARVFAGPR